MLSGGPAVFFIRILSQKIFVPKHPSPKFVTTSRDLSLKLYKGAEIMKTHDSLCLHLVKTVSSITFIKKCLESWTLIREVTSKHKKEITLS